MIEIDGKQYELKYTTKRIDTIEAVTKIPVMSVLTQNNGILSRAHLETYIAFGLKEIGSDSFVDTGKAREMARALIETEGYGKCLGITIEAIDRDCGFFFLES